MIHTIGIYHSVWVINPVAGRSIVYLRTILLVARCCLLSGSYRLLRLNLVKARCNPSNFESSHAINDTAENAIMNVLRSFMILFVLTSL